MGKKNGSSVSNEEELPILKKTSSGTYEKVYAGEDELPILRPKSNAPSSQGGESGAQTPPSTSTSASATSSLGSWTTEANPLKPKEQPVQVPVAKGKPMPIQEAPSDIKLFEGGKTIRQEPKKTKLGTVAFDINEVKRKVAENPIEPVPLTKDQAFNEVKNLEKRTSAVDSLEKGQSKIFADNQLKLVDTEAKLKTIKDQVEKAKAEGNIEGANQLIESAQPLIAQYDAQARELRKQAKKLEYLDSRKKTLESDMIGISEGQQYTTNQWQALNSGLNNLTAGVLRAPSFVYNSMIALQNKIAKETGIPISANPQTDGYLQQAAQYFQDNADAYNKVIEKKKAQTDYNIQNLLEKGETLKAFNLLSESVMESAPTTAAIALSGMMGVGALGTTMGGAAVFGNQTFEENKKNGIDDNTNYLNSWVNGTLEGIFEATGTLQIVKHGADLFKKEGKKAVEETAKTLWEQVYGKVAKKMFPATSAVLEGVSEAETAFTQNYVNMISGVDTEYKKDYNNIVNSDMSDLDKEDALSELSKKHLFQGVPDAFYVGAAMGTGMGVMQAKQGYTAVNDEKRNEIKKAQETLDNLNKTLTNPLVSSEAKDIIQAKADAEAEKIALIAEQDDKDLRESLTKDEYEAVTNIQVKIETLEKSLGAIEDKDSKGLIEQQIKELESEKQVFLNKSIDNIVSRVQEKRKELGVEFNIFEDLPKNIVSTFDRIEGNLNDFMEQMEKEITMLEAYKEEQRKAAESTLKKNTSPTNEKYGTVNRNDGKGIVDLTKEEYLKEEGKTTAAIETNTKVVGDKIVENETTPIVDKKADIERRRQEELNSALIAVQNSKNKEELTQAAEEWIGINPYDDGATSMGTRSLLLTPGSFEKGKQAFIDENKKSSEIRDKQINAKYDAALAVLEQHQTQQPAQQDALVQSVETNPALRDVESTAKALEEGYKKQNPHSGGGLSGDAKSFDELPDNSEVYVYTATTPENAKAILSGDKDYVPQMQGQGIKGESSGIYVASDPRVVSGMGKTIIGFKVKKSDLELSPEAKKSNQTLGKSVITSGTGAILKGEPLLKFIAENQERINTSAKSGNEALAEAYHKAKADGTNPELVKAVEQSLPTQEVKVENKPTISKEQAEPGEVIDEKIVKSRVKRIAKSLNVDEQRSQQIHDIALEAKDYEDFKRKVDELGVDDTVSKNIHAEQYREIRDKVKSAYQEQLEKNLEDLREGYSDVTRSEAGLRKITEKSPSSIRDFINRILHGTTPEDVAKSKARLADIQKQYRKEKAEMKSLLPRERGVNFVVEKISRAARNGEISQLNADLAIDLLRANPSIFEDLAISITKKGTNDESGVQGWYRAADALVKIFKGGADETTAVHEILHHTERFLPNEIRDKIIKEWHNEVNKQIEHYQKLLKNTKNVDERQQITQVLLYLGLALERQVEPNRANVEAMEAIMSKYLGDHTDSKGNFHKGLGNSWYQLYNPSEWWAVNASRILKEAKTKPELKTFYDKVKAFYDGLIQSVKKIFNNPYSAVEKGLKTILNGETLEDREGAMLSASKKLLNIKQKGSFEDRLKSIYDEVKSKQVKAVEDLLGTPPKTQTPTEAGVAQDETLVESPLSESAIESEEAKLSELEEILEDDTPDVKELARQYIASQTDEKFTPKEQALKEIFNVKENENRKQNNQQKDSTGSGKKANSQEGKIEGEQVKPKTAKEIAKEKLDEARANFRKAQGKMQSGGLGALPEFIDLVKAAIEYGFESSKEFLKEFRNDIDTKYSDKEVEAAFDSIVNPSSVEKPNFKLDGEGKEKERSFTNKQFLADKSIPDNVKAAVTEDAIFYNELPNSVSVEVANKIYDLLGANEALDAILDDTNGMSPVVRIVLGQVIIRRAKLQGGSKAEADIMLKAEALLAKKGTEYGQAIQAFSLFQFLSKEGQILYAKKQRQQEIDAKLKKDKKSVDARKKAVTDINEKVIDEVLEGKVGEVIEETTKIKPKAQSKHKDYGEKNKIVTKKRVEEIKKALKGKFFSSVIPPPELIELGVYHIEAGSRKFADFSKAMIDDLGTGVKKYLKDLYDKSKSDYESKGGDISDFSNESEIADVENQDQAEKLAKFIVNRAKQKKQSNDPAKQMISSLLAKVGEKLPKRELEKMSDIDKIALAIKNREEYADVWEKSKAEVEALIDKMKVSEEEKETMRNDLQSYYDEVIGQPFSQTTLNKAVKEGLNELGIDVKDVIRKHYTVADNDKRTLVDKLVMDANLSESDAKYLAEKVEREFNSIATERKKQALDKLKKPKDKLPPKNKKINALEDEIIALSNLGAFNDADFLKTYADKMGWEQISEDDLRTIGKLAEIVEKEQDGFRRARAVEDLLSFQAKMKGSNLGDVAMSLWYANVLSGPTTQLVNIVANTTNLALNYGMALTKDITDIKGITKSMLIGFQRGLLEGFSTMQTGYLPIRGKIEVPNTLELIDFKNIMKPANAAKFVRRFMVAADVLTFEAAKEMRAYQLSRKLAREEGNNLPKQAQRQRALEIMGNTKEKVAEAKAQAQAEYDARVKRINDNPDLTAKEKADAIKTEKKDIKRRVFELIEQQRTKASANIIPKSEEYARRLTYNYTPEGVMGLIAAGVNFITRFKPVKFIIPFTNIIANVANESLNYSPVGFARAATSQGSIGKAIDNLFGTNVIKANENFEKDSDLRNEMIMKAAFGTLVTAAIFALAGDSDDDEMEITADGYGNYKDNYSLTEKGWQPYSIRVGKKWISYQYTPLMPMLAFIGKIKDGQRYRKEKFNEDYMTKIASAAGSMVKTFFDSTFLSSMNTFLNAVFNENTENTVEDMIKGLSKTANSFVLPNAYTQIAKEVERKMDVPVKDMDDRYYAQVLKDIPFARNIFQNKVNALGDDVIPDTDKFISEVKIIDPKVVNENDLWAVLARNKYPIRTQSYNQFNNDGIYDPIKDKQRVITPEEYYNYMKVKGGTIKEFMLKNYQDLKSLDEKEFAYVMNKVKEEATSIGKMSIFKDYFKEEIEYDIEDLMLMDVAAEAEDYTITQEEKKLNIKQE